MKIIRFLTFLVAAIVLYSCTETAMMAEIQPTADAPKDAPVSADIYRRGADLNIDFVIPKGGWDFTSVLSNDGQEYTLVIKNLDRPIGEFQKINVIRPIERIDTRQYPSGFKLVFHLSTPQQLLSATRTETGLQVRLASVKPDVELLSIKVFGGWADPQTPARTFQGVMKHGDKTEIMFDNPVVYSTGTAGGRYYLDIFNVDILPGTVKYKSLLASNNLEGKNRLIFSEPVTACPEGNSLTIGMKCVGYSSMWGFKREKNDRTESFQVSLPGRPEMTVRESDGLVAFGFDDTMLFSEVLQRFSDGDVYKVEVREKDGKLWLVFLYEGDLKYRKYYSGDKFFVVFYR